MVTSDDQIMDSIERLVAEEHRLWEAESHGEASEEDRQRLRELKVALDQYWDLLRQRRGLEEFGRDADSAQTRPPDVVERYRQ